MDSVMDEEDFIYGTSNHTNYPLIRRITPAILSSVCFISFLVSLPGVIIGIHEYCVKNRVSNFRTERVFLYFTLGISFTSFVGSFQWLGAWLHSSVFSLCAAIGYLSFASFMFDITITLCIAVHFILQLYPPKMLVVVHEDKVIKYQKLEIVYLLTSVLVTLCLSPWPFFGLNFQFNDWICWITLDHGNSGSSTIASYTLIIFYTLATVIFLFAVCVVLMVKILLCIYKRSIDNIYMWVFSLYLLCSLINIIVTSAIFYLTEKSTESRISDGVKAVSIVCIGISPLMASISTSIAVTYKRVRRLRRISSKPKTHTLLTSRTQIQHYKTMERRVACINDELAQNAMSSSHTYWIPPATHNISSQSSD